jgi:Tfp pilus assembly protein PilF
MTRIHLVLALSAGLLGSAAVAQDRTAGEIGYAPGTLGYDALRAGDLRTAEIQIESAQGIDAADPARLINLGYIHMRTGRIQTAQRLFEAARDSRQPVMLELANGETMSSRDVARRALARLAPIVAGR